MAKLKLPFELEKPSANEFVTQASEIGHKGDSLERYIDNLNNRINNIAGGVVEPANLGNYMVNNGTITSNDAQTCIYIDVKSGQIYNVVFTGTPTTVRYGLYDNKPQPGDSTNDYSSFSSASEQTISINHDGYLTLSYARDNVTGVSFTLLNTLFNQMEAEIDTIEDEVDDIKQQTKGLIDVSVEPSVLGNYYVNNGVIEALEIQTCMYVALDAGDVIEITFDMGIVETRIRWGYYESSPQIGSTTNKYYNEVVSNGGTIQLTTNEDCYVAFSYMTSSVTSISVIKKAQIIPQLQADVEDCMDYCDSLRTVIGQEKKPIAMVEGYYVLNVSAGDEFVETRYSGGTYKCAKIECSENDTFVLNAQAGSSSKLFLWVDSDNIALNTPTSGILSDVKIVAPVDAKYLYINDNSNSTSYSGEGYIFDQYGEMIAEEGNYSSYSDNFTLSQLESKTLEENFVRKNASIAMSVGSFTGVRLGVGYNSYKGHYIEVDNTYVKVFRDQVLIANGTFTHGLNVSLGINVSIYQNIINIDAEQELDRSLATIIITDAYGGVFSQEVQWWGAGSPFVTNLGTSAIDGNISWFCCDLKEKIWMFGDSYFSWTQKSRWLYYMLEYGYRHWLASHLPGGNSALIYATLNVLKKYGSPKYIVWCLGMNDSSDTTSYGSDWKTYIDLLLDYCASKGITPILATIPTAANDDSSGLKNNEKKNEWVRNSGYRFIDFAKAVGANADGTWRTGLKGADIHPSVLGAKVLAGQVLVDFPEIMQY